MRILHVRALKVKEKHTQDQRDSKWHGELNAMARRWLCSALALTARHFSKSIL